MNYFESILLGLVQGLGEFLPISSSAHLVIMPWFIKFTDPGLGFDVALHLGTLFAVMVYFWKDWLKLGQGSLCYLTSSQRTEDHKKAYRMMIYLIIATIPAVIAGLLLKDLAETTLRSPLLIGANMILLGVILMWADKKSSAHLDWDHIGLKEAFLIGLAQCVALLPGSSRSGCTITAALMLGLNRADAARFSFMMSTPIILGACVFKYKYFSEAFSSPEALMGIVVSAVVGFLSIKYLIRLVQRFSYAAFCYYRYAFGILVFVVYYYRLFSGSSIAP